MLFSTAFAQTAAGGGSDFQAQLVQFAPLIMIAAVFYFLLIRPQQQRAKQLKTALAALRRGDKIVTAGGMIASVSRVINDDEVEVEIAAGIKVRVVRSTITTILSKPEPAGKDAGKDKGGKSGETKDAEAETGEGGEGTDGSAKRRRGPAKPAGKAPETEAADAKPTDAPK
ncbi:hypothetical protein GCM10011611_19390 [Aliidongia dinghuensis]|uniref:Sec translocon accessory complex subunit YajC n=1 Tax=Aliidongia dinghuensis TaxID=1867774 RepID=A0A8J2YT01_9PROT|nr:preprotein translocase subunit YajC [Aliidongia dinghuensis]GGF13782.1 hypothetical protein GCM10011611_19390 [Aliidongia dinghuensis]